MNNLLKKALVKSHSKAVVVQRAANYAGHTVKQFSVMPHNLCMTQEKMHAYATAKVAEHATELNNVELSFDFVLGMDLNMVAAYFPESHTIAFPAHTQQIIEQAITLGMKWETYVDCVIAHEMGHVLDPEVSSYIAALQAQDGVYNQRRYMANNMFALEVTAEELGAQFAKDKKAFRLFNKANQTAYNKVIKQIRESIGGR